MEIVIGRTGVRTFFERAACGSIALAFVVCTCWKPAVLRHDWFPLGAGGFGQAIEQIAGWNRQGLGAPTGYPSSFLLVPLLAAIAAVATSYGAQFALFSAIAAIVVWAAFRFARAISAGTLVTVATTASALFNPWVYVQIVAGHSYMLLAYAATLALAAELSGRAPSARIVALCLLGIVGQIQFFVLVAPLAAAASLRCRDARPAVVYLALALPIAIGVLASAPVLAATPLTLAWERTQSVAAPDIFFLRGYFAQYDRNLGAWTTPALALWVVVAVTGAVLIVRRRRPAAVAALVILGVLSFVSGTLGPLRDVVSFAFLHVPAIGLFRELYDLLGFVAIGYAGFAAYAAARVRPLAGIWCVSSLAAAAAWLGSPPLDYAVDARTLPALHFACHDVRFAMLPVIQPMSFRSQGSGLDPDTYDHGGASSLNGPALNYPLDRAFGLLARDGDAAPLARLGAGEVVVRPGLRSRSESNGASLAFPLPAYSDRLRAPDKRCLDASPLVARSAGLPPLVARPPLPGTNAVLYSDAADARGPGVPATWAHAGTFVAIQTPRVESAARLGWVDARLGFFEHPELAQPYGGALTTDGAAVLAIAQGTPVLASVTGRLFGGARVIARSSEPTYRWIDVPADVSTLRCEGLCVVAAQGRPSVAAAMPQRWPFHALPYRWPLSWYLTTSLPPGPAGTLRFESTFDPHWIALFGGRTLAHVRLDGYANGWILPTTVRNSEIVLVDWAAATIAFSEVLAVAIVSAALLSRPRFKRSG